MTLCGVVHYLIERAGYEINELKFDHGAKPDRRRSARSAYETRFGYGRINHAVRAEFVEKALSYFERAAECAYVFAEYEYARVAAHLCAQRVAYRL
jgi:hypothetical protein